MWKPLRGASISFTVSPSIFLLGCYSPYMRYALLCLVPSLCYGLVVADPISVHPDIKPSWVSGLDDDFIPGAPDDNLTVAFSGGTSYGNWKLGGSYNIYTKKWMTSSNQEGDDRIDELAGTIGYQFCKDGFSVLPAVGVSANGDYRGKEVQHRWHEFFRVTDVDATYKDHSFVDPLVLIDSRYSYAMNPSSKLIPIVQYEYNGHTQDVQATLEYVYKNLDDDRYTAEIFIGPRWNRTFGHEQSIVKNRVNAYYNEVSLVAGIHDGVVLVDIAVGRKGSYGEIGIDF